MTPVVIAEAARLLAEARRSGPTLEAFPASCRPLSLGDAHAIQLATAECMGDSIGGWKVGATPEGRLARGALLRSRLISGGSHVDASTLPLLGVECEIAFRFDRDLGPRSLTYAYEEVADAVTALPGIEIVDSRFVGYPKAPLLDRIADCMSNGAFVLGTPRSDWREFDLAGLDVELVIDGRTIVRRTGGHPARDPLLPAVALVNDLRSSVGVRAGEIVTTGTYTGLNFALPGQRVVAIFHGFGTAEVTFDDAATRAAR